MTIFVLLHGSCHTPNCWRLLRGVLEGRGHTVVTPNLHVDDPANTPDSYLSIALEAIESAPEPPVVVGHSLAGLTTYRLDGAAPVAGLVFLGSAIPLVPGMNPGEPPDMNLIPVEAMTPDEHGVISLSPEVATAVFYNDLDGEVLDAALADLVTQSVNGIGAAPDPLHATAVPSAYIVCTADAAIRNEWSAWFAGIVTGRAPIPIAASHSPFLSRPAELADRLEELAADFARRLDPAEEMA